MYLVSTKKLHINNIYYYGFYFKYYKTFYIYLYTGKKDKIGYNYVKTFNNIEEIFNFLRVKAKIRYDRTKTSTDCKPLWIVHRVRFNREQECKSSNYFRKSE